MKLVWFASWFLALSLTFPAQAAVDLSRAEAFKAAMKLARETVGKNGIPVGLLTPRTFYFRETAKGYVLHACSDLLCVRRYLALEIDRNHALVHVFATQGPESALFGRSDQGYLLALSAIESLMDQSQNGSAQAESFVENFDFIGLNYNSMGAGQLWSAVTVAKKDFELNPVQATGWTEMFTSQPYHIAGSMGFSTCTDKKSNTAICLTRIYDSVRPPAHTLVLSDFLGSEDEPLFLTHAEARKECERLGGHLPSIRDLAKLSLSLGARSISESRELFGVPVSDPRVQLEILREGGSGRFPVYASNSAGETVVDFYFGVAGYKSDERQAFWSDYIDPIIEKQFPGKYAYVFLSETGDVTADSFMDVTRKSNVRCMVAP